MHVFVDLDGVLADFCQAVVDLHYPGVPDVVVVDRGCEMKPDEHPFKQFEAGLHVTTNEMWFNIALRGSTFWSGMKLLPMAMELWETLNETIPGQVSILSSPGKGSNTGNVAHGKYQWVYHHLGKEATYQTILCPSTMKHHMARGNILIDDYDENIKRWSDAGGHAIHWPSMSFHRRHATKADLHEAMQTVAKLVMGDGA